MQCAAGRRVRLSVVQAVAQVLSLLQSSPGQPKVLLQAVDLPLAALLHPTELLARPLVPLAGQPLLLHGQSHGAEHDEQWRATEVRKVIILCLYN